jgi:hypothetical protein
MLLRPPVFISTITGAPGLEVERQKARVPAGQADVPRSLTLTRLRDEPRSFLVTGRQDGGADRNPSSRRRRIHHAGPEKRPMLLVLRTVVAGDPSLELAKEDRSRALMARLEPVAARAKQISSSQPRSVIGAGNDWQHDPSSAVQRTAACLKARAATPCDDGSLAKCHCFKKWTSAHPRKSLSVRGLCSCQQTRKTAAFSAVNSSARSASIRVLCGVLRGQFQGQFWGQRGFPQLEASRILRVLDTVRWPRG